VVFPKGRWRVDVKEGATFRQEDFISLLRGVEASVITTLGS